MVIPTTPTQKNKGLFESDPTTGVTLSSSADTRPGAKFRGASVEVRQLLALSRALYSIFTQFLFFNW